MVKDLIKGASSLQFYHRLLQRYLNLRSSITKRWIIICRTMGSNWLDSLILSINLSMITWTVWKDSWESLMSRRRMINLWFIISRYHKGRSRARIDQQYSNCKVCPIRDRGKDIVNYKYSLKGRLLFRRF